jgi:hypothetical protein
MRHHRYSLKTFLGAAALSASLGCGGPEDDTSAMALRFSGAALAEDVKVLRIDFHMQTRKCSVLREAYKIRWEASRAIYTKDFSMPGSGTSLDMQGLFPQVYTIAVVGGESLESSPKVFGCVENQAIADGERATVSIGVDAL